MKTPLRFLLTALAAGLAAAPSARALDFTLQRIQAANGSMQLTKTYFTDGDSKIFIDIPADWKVTDSPASLDCLPPRGSSRVVIEQAGSKPWAFDEPGKIALRKRVADSIPAGAKAVEPLPEQADIVPLSGWSSLEMANSYEFFGQKMHRAVLFFNLPEKRVWQVTITAPEADFKDLHEQTRVMLYDLFEPNKMLSGDALQRYQNGVTD